MANRGKPLVGIVGGVASGKSFIAQQLARKGAAVVSADGLAHEVLKLDEVKNEVRKRWGEAVFGSDGQIDRAALARIVFAPPPDGPRELKQLEALTHPKIGEMARNRVVELMADDTVEAIVMDVPLMFESGWNKFCDKVVFVDAPQAVREARAATRGWTPEEFARREAMQESLATKCELADFVIDNSGSAESAQAQVERFWHWLVSSSPPH